MAYEGLNNKFYIFRNIIAGVSFLIPLALAILRSGIFINHKNAVKTFIYKLGYINLQKVDLQSKELV